MNPARQLIEPPVARFRTKLLVAMAVLILGLTALGLFLAQRKVAVEAEWVLQQDFRYELALLHGVQEVRHAALAERCRALVRRPRIHAALEDNALDLLYPNAKDELRDVMSDEEAAETPAHALHARFYRFLDGTGAVISPDDGADVGELKPEEEAQLTLGALPNEQQIGYLLRNADTAEQTVDEVIAMPISSTETGEVIAALVLGFKPVALGRDRAETEIKSGVWVNGRLNMPEFPAFARAALTAEVARAVSGPNPSASKFSVKIGGAPHLVFHKQLNPGSLFPPAHEVAVYPLTQAFARQARIRWQVLGTGAALLLGGILASHFLSGRLATPVEKLAVDSEENREQRVRAEAALELTSGELQRAARFSADASHQLKTPVTVLRAGLDELLADDSISPEIHEEVGALVHQTYRLTSIIEDLLLLSRMDAGRLEIDFSPVDLTQLIEAMIDDLSALPDELDVAVETDCPSMEISGEKRYVALILQNLLENARKYNRSGGRIRIGCREEGGDAFLTIGNTGPAIPSASQEHIFERFHRGTSCENVPGHGLGLNLARELTRLHGGDLRLVRSNDGWTEFEARFPLAQSGARAPLEVV